MSTSISWVGYLFFYFYDAISDYSIRILYILFGGGVGPKSDLL